MYTRTVKVEKKELGLEFRSTMEFFDSAVELYEVTKNRPEREYDDVLNREHHSISWCGGISSTEEAVRMLYEGWEDKVPEARLMVRNVQKSLPQTKRSIQNGPVGFAPIVPLAIMGVPNSMIADARKPVKSRVIELYYDFGSTGDTSARDLTWAGMRALAEIIRLERRGYRIRLYGVHWQSCDRFGDAAVVKLKDEWAPIDLKRLMFPLFHPGYFRIIHFGWYVRAPVKSHLSGYGTSIYRFSQKVEDEIVNQCLGPHAVFISADRMIRLRHDENRVDDYLKRRLERIGVKTETS